MCRALHKAASFPGAAKQQQAEISPLLQMAQRLPILWQRAERVCTAGNGGYALPPPFPPHPSQSKEASIHDPPQTPPKGNRPRRARPLRGARAPRDHCCFGRPCTAVVLKPRQGACHATRVCAGNHNNQGRSALAGRAPPRSAALPAFPPWPGGRRRGGNAPTLHALARPGAPTRRDTADHPFGRPESIGITPVTWRCSARFAACIPAPRRQCRWPES